MKRLYRMFTLGLWATSLLAVAVDPVHTQDVWSRRFAEAATTYISATRRPTGPKTIRSQPKAIGRAAIQRACASSRQKGVW
jgi:hypothetical protein